MITDVVSIDENQLNRIEQKLERLETFLDQMPGMMAIMTDSVDEITRQAKTRDIDLTERIQEVLKLSTRLSDPVILNAFHALMDFIEKSPGLISVAVDSLDETMKDNSWLHPQQWKMLPATAVALQEAFQSHPEKLGGLWSLYKMTKDPDRQKALSFLMQFLKNLGQKL